MTWVSLYISKHDDDVCIQTVRHVTGATAGELSMLGACRWSTRRRRRVWASDEQLIIALITIHLSRHSSLIQGCVIDDALIDIEVLEQT